MNAIPVQLAEIARIAALLEPLCEEDDTLFADMMEGESDLHSIVTRIHNQIARDEEILTGIAERKANLAERERRIKDRLTVSKAAIGKFLRAARQTKIELPEASYSVRDGKPKLVVVSPDAVPAEYCRVKTEPDKPAINAAFEGRDDLPNWLTLEPAIDIVTARKR